MMIFALSVLIPGSMSVAEARPASATASAQTQTPFLTLPFVPNGGMSILSGWYYSSSGGFHGGIDYINGNVNNLRTWSTFQVVASADGEACGNCSGRQGNAVWVKHNIGGKTYYTYYGHMASIAQGIPIGSQSRTVKVKRGQLLGMAGDTGAGRGVLHLHFALYNSSSQPLDPYSIGKLRQYYPAPTSAQPGVGWFLR
jgi:murein DD-endopeptidase MepM/ murein hydrolase activator NlpD